jgi:hypothetical protein
MQSATCVGVTGPLDLNHERHLERYNRLIKALGLEDLSADDRIEKLRTLPSEDLVEVLKKHESPDIAFNIAMDRKLACGFWKVKDGLDDHKSVLVGNTRHDVLFLIL